jgi:hypothetical protein
VENVEDNRMAIDITKPNFREISGRGR